MNSLPVKDLRTAAERAQQEARDRTARASALLAKVDATLRKRAYDLLWEQRRNANPWKPFMRSEPMREPFE